jgi:hypothetical protein
MSKMVCSVDPLSIMCKDCRKQSNWICRYFLRMLFTKGGNSLEGCCFKGVHETISDNFYLNRLSLKDRMLGNSNSSMTSRDSDLCKLTTLILGWVPVVKYTKCISQDFRKPLPIQTSGMSICLSIPINPLNICHLNQKDSNVRLDINSLEL